MKMHHVTDLNDYQFVKIPARLRCRGVVLLGGLVNTEGARGVILFFPLRLPASLFSPPACGTSLLSAQSAARSALCIPRVHVRTHVCARNFLTVPSIAGSVAPAALPQGGAPSHTPPHLTGSHKSLLASALA